MPSLFENAAASIRMGVEDYRQQDEYRNLSAVRNLFSGVLLLAKEVLIREVPQVEPQEIIAASFKPVPDGEGGVTYTPSKSRSIDFEGIQTRFRDFGLSIDRQSLSDLNQIRNDVEHHFTDKSDEAIRTAIAKAFPVVSSLFRQLGEDPAVILEDSWVAMLEERTLYEHELTAARASLAGVAWHAECLRQAPLVCEECTSNLMEQVDPENTQQDHMELRCRSCGSAPATADIVEQVIEQVFGGEAYMRAKDGGGEGPVYDCPACGRHTYVDQEDVCANCGETLDYESTCQRCGSGISMQDYLDGLDGGLCSYCTYQHERVMRE